MYPKELRDWIEPIATAIGQSLVDSINLTLPDGSVMTLSNEDIDPRNNYSLLGSIFECALRKALNGRKESGENAPDITVTFNGIDYPIECKCLRRKTADVEGSAERIGRLYVIFWIVENEVTFSIPRERSAKGYLKPIERPVALRHRPNW